MNADQQQASELVVRVPAEQFRRLMASDAPDAAPGLRAMVESSAQQVDVEQQTYTAIRSLDRDGAYFVLGALSERVPDDVLAAVRLYQTVLGPR